MTTTLPAPSPFENPSPRRIFLSDAKSIDDHHRMVTSPAFQQAISVAQQEYARALCSLSPLGGEDENVLNTKALHMARLQGATDIIAMLCGLAELPKAQPKNQPQSPPNLEN